MGTEWKNPQELLLIHVIKADDDSSISYVQANMAHILDLVAKNSPDILDEYRFVPADTWYQYESAKTRISKQAQEVKLTLYGIPQDALESTI